MCLLFLFSVVFLLTSLYSLVFYILVQGEIGVFFPLIILRSLDSSDSPLSQKASVLR
jgi:guanine nucleotide-exchange factor